MKNTKKKKQPPEVFCVKRCSQKFCEICQNTFFTEHLWTAAIKKGTKLIESGEKKIVKTFFFKT